LRRKSKKYKYSPDVDALVTAFSGDKPKCGEETGENLRKLRGKVSRASPTKGLGEAAEEEALRVLREVFEEEIA
jgi:hypothetical protein